MQPRGTLLEEGEHATLTFRRIYRHTVEHVWEALTTPEGLREWLMCSRVLIDARVGGRIEMVSLLDRLEAQLDDREQPDWLYLMRELHPHYPEWSGHAPRPAE